MDSKKFILKFCDDNGHAVCFTCCIYDSSQVSFIADRQLVEVIANYLTQNIYNLHRSFGFEAQKVKDEVNSQPDFSFNLTEALKTYTLCSCAPLSGAVILLP